MFKNKNQVSNLEVLEPRLLFFADRLANVFDIPSSKDTNTVRLEQSPDNSMRLPRASQDQPTPLLQASDEDPTDLNTAATPACYVDMPTNDAKLEIVFVDTSTPDYQQLLDGVLASDNTRVLEVVMIDSSVDGIAVISSTLSRYQNIDAVHVISHWANGILILGSTPIDQQYLNKFSGIFSSWSDAFSDNADLLLYGCDVASTIAGRHFIHTLGRLTGTDAITPKHANGRTSLGADWSFVCQTAAIEKPLSVSTLIQDN